MSSPCANERFDNIEAQLIVLVNLTLRNPINRFIAVALSSILVLFVLLISDDAHWLGHLSKMHCALERK